MIDVRYGADRGVTRLDWLCSRHSFSFGSYYDAQHMGISALRVINDDRVQPGAGFASHSHRDMEIMTYVKRGAIEHQDSRGNTRVLSSGEFQLMSAGTGITHSEYNASAHEPLEFLQIWIVPDIQGIEPGYQQKRFDIDTGLCLIASPDGRDGSLRLQQDARVFHLRSARAQTIAYSLVFDRTAYLHVVGGGLSLDTEVLRAGDGAHIAEVDNVVLKTEDDSEALLFDLPQYVLPPR
ncbi:MAG: pirin family protein [Gammaproteobacteria bacterium]|nr:pirin family protein [Gammaproteobacteria bacterium]